MIGTDGSRRQTVRSDDAALRLIQPQSRDRHTRAGGRSSVSGRTYAEIQTLETIIGWVAHDALLTARPDTMNGS